MALSVTAVDPKDRIMVDRNTDIAGAARGRVVREVQRAGESRTANVVHTKLETARPLTIDDGDFGTDPYNHTGRFTSLKKD